MSTATHFVPGMCSLSALNLQVFSKCDVLYPELLHAWFRIWGKQLPPPLPHSVCLCVHICLSVHLSIRLTDLPTYLPTYLPAHLCIHLSIHPPTNPPTHPSAYLFVHLPTYISRQDKQGTNPWKTCWCYIICESAKVGNHRPFYLYGETSPFTKLHRNRMGHENLMPISDDKQAA
jgi:hypothetical protein